MNQEKLFIRFPLGTLIAALNTYFKEYAYKQISYSATILAIMFGCLVAYIELSYSSFASNIV